MRLLLKTLRVLIGIVVLVIIAVPIGLYVALLAIDLRDPPPVPKSAIE